MPRCTTSSIRSAISSRGKSTSRDALLPWPSGALSQHRSPLARWRSRCISTSLRYFDTTDQPRDRLLEERAGAPGVPVTLHLAPGSADHVLADRPGEHRRQRAPHPAGVSPGQIGPGDQRIGVLGAALVGAKRRALHSLVLPSAPISRARGTAMRVLPNVPVSVRARWPWRTPTTSGGAPGVSRP